MTIVERTQVVKGTYRALGIVTALALLGGILRDSLEINRMAGYSVYLVPSSANPQWIESVYFYRTFAILGLGQTVSMLQVIWAILAVTVAAQARRTGWLVALAALAASLLLLPYGFLVAHYGLAIPYTSLWLRLAPPAEWLLFIAGQVATFVFVATRPRPKMQSTDVASTTPHTITPETPTL